MTTDANQKLTKNIKNISAQIAFNNRVFLAQSVKQFLFILYRESVKHFKIQSLICCWNSGHFGLLKQVCFKGGGYEGPPLTVWPERKILGPGDQEVRQYAARELGRPVQSVLTIPLSIRKYMVTDPPPCLFAEFVAGQKASVQEFYQEILPLITGCLDRLLLEDHLRAGLDLLYTTFNKLPEPLAILDKDKKLTSANKIFKKFPSLSKNIRQKNWQNGNKVYEQQNYPICVRGAPYTVYHYVDMTESLSLRNHMIQNEKMSALGKLGETVAHELNNPLTGLLSMAQLLLEFNSLNEETKQDMKDIAAAAWRSQKIIAHLLDFSQLQDSSVRKKAYLSDTVCDLNTAVQSTLAFVKTLTAGIDLQVELAKDSLRVRAELCLLQQVIFNLVKNACQAISSLKDLPDKKVKISVKYMQNQAMVLVEDSGLGVKTQDYANIFKPFFTTKSPDKGTGLGLSLSANIVHNFKGRLKVSLSALGGACFILSLPAVTGKLSDKEREEWKYNESADCR